MTLPEILIAFTVIGVIAVLAIPTFMKFQHDKDIVTRLEASRATLAHATKIAETNIGNLEDWDLADLSNAEIFRTYYKPYIQTGRNCVGHASDNCWSKTTSFFGSAPDGGAKYGITGNAEAAFTLSDGINVSLAKTAVVEEKFGTESKLPTSLVFMVDVNGHTGPNAIGKDVFAFILTDNGLLPAGTDNFSANCTKGNDLNDDYWDCCSKVIADKTRDYM